MITFYYLYLFVQEGATHTRVRGQPAEFSPCSVVRVSGQGKGKGLHQLSPPTSTAMIIF